MSRTADDIAEIVRLVEGSSFDELSLELDGLKLAFKRSASGVAKRRRDGQADGAFRCRRAAPASASARRDVCRGSNLQTRSPMLGTFIARRSPRRLT